MLSLTLLPTPKLIVNDEEFFGINIVEKLHEIIHSEDDTFKQDAQQIFLSIANIFKQIEIPLLGFRLTQPNAVLPKKRISDVGYDLTVVDVYSKLTPMTYLYETHIALDIPLGYYVEIVPRSSISKTGYILANSVGIIDPSYTGTLKVSLIKIDNSMPDIKLPFRIAQLILKPYIISNHKDTTHEEAIDTKRGSGGFGSTN